MYYYNIQQDILIYYSQNETDVLKIKIHMYNSEHTYIHHKLNNVFNWFILPVLKHIDFHLL